MKNYAVFPLAFVFALVVASVLGCHPLLMEPSSEPVGDTDEAGSSLPVADAPLPMDEPEAADGDEQDSSSPDDHAAADPADPEYADADVTNPDDSDPDEQSGPDTPHDGSTGDAPADEDPSVGEHPNDQAPLDDASCVDDHLYPVPTWATAMPEDHGFDPALLNEAATYAAENRSNCLVVVRHGAIVGEWYWQDTTPTTKVKNWSVAKAWSATVLGVAIDRGDLPGVGAPASNWIESWQDTAHSAITLHDLLSMSSGLVFDAVADNFTIPLADDMTTLAVDAAVANPPGALWEYNNHSVQSLEPVLRQATGMAADEYANQHLFEPMGMDVEWKRDAVGQPALYMNAKASCRDNARMGYLYLRRGCFNGQRLLSEEWVDQATTPSTAHNRGYGYYWWLSGEDPTLDSVDFSTKPDGGLHPYAPNDAFCAVGLGSQFIEVIPSLDLVVVRTGTAPQDMPDALFHPFRVIEEANNDGKQIVHNGVLERVLNALTEP